MKLSPSRPWAIIGAVSAVLYVVLMIFMANQPNGAALLRNVPWFILIAPLLIFWGVGIWSVISESIGNEP